MCYFKHVIISAVLVTLIGTFFGGVDAFAQHSQYSIDDMDGVDLDEEKLGESIATDVTFLDSNGKEVKIADYFDGERPVLLNLVYHECPMLCNLMLDEFTVMLQDLSWTPGEEFEVLTVSFNADETPELAKQQKDRYMNIYGRSDAEDGWHFLTGDEEAVQALTESVGFSFKWIEEEQDYAHPAAAIFLSGEGKITRFIHGVAPNPRDTRMALREASDGNVGSIIDQAIMYCFQFDPSENAYVANAFNIMRLAALFAVFVLGGVLFVFWRREKQNQERDLLEGIGDGRFARQGFNE